MRNYEIMFILSTQLSDDEKKAGVTLVEETLSCRIKNRNLGRQNTCISYQEKRKRILCSDIVPDWRNKITWSRSKIKHQWINIEIYDS